MSKTQSLPGGIIKLTKLLEHLNKPPKLAFTKNVKNLRLTFAYQNDHWSARHFVKEDLPRIRHANPDLEIDVVRWRKEKNEHWRPELEIKFDDGRVRVVNMDTKASSTILKEVMSIAGGDPWKTHVEEANKAGTPIIPGEPPNDEPAATKKPLPNLWEFRKANPQKEKKAEQVRKEWAERRAEKKKGEAGKRESKGTEMVNDTPSAEGKPSSPSPVTASS